MSGTFRLKVAARRQTTLPQDLLDSLLLGEGDVLELNVQGSSIVSGRGLKLLPTNLFTSEMVEQLHKREQEIARGRNLEAENTKDLLTKLAKRTHSGTVPQTQTESDERTFETSRNR